MIHPRADEDALGTKPLSRCTGQGGTHTKFSGFITCGTHHTTLCRRCANDHGQATQLRVVALFHGSVERIHIQMEDHSKHLAESLSKYALTASLAARRLNSASGFGRCLTCKTGLIQQAV